MNNTELKAKLFDLQNTVEYLKQDREQTMMRYNDAQETITELRNANRLVTEELEEKREQLDNSREVLVKRGAMIRDLVRENRQLKNTPISSDGIKHIQEEVAQEIIDVITERFTQGRGFNF